MRHHIAFVIVVAALLLSFPSFVHAQYDDWRNVGSAKQLKGKVAVVSFFATEKGWSKSDINEVKKELLYSEEWIKKEAQRYGKYVEFVNLYYGTADAPLNAQTYPQLLSHIPDFNDYLSDLGSNPLLPKLIHSLKWTTSGFCDWVKEKYGTDNIVTILFADRPGKCYACYYKKGADYETRFLESSYIFVCDNHKDGDGDPISHSIVHEILHCFGAVDLYPEQLDKHISDTWVKYTIIGTCSNDVMHGGLYSRNEHELYNLSYENVGNLTAWLLGWLDDKDAKDWYPKVLKK